MNEWTVRIDFGTYETNASMWAKDQNEVRKYCKKHYPHGTILSIKQL